MCPIRPRIIDQKAIINSGALDPATTSKKGGVPFDWHAALRVASVSHLLLLCLTSHRFVSSFFLSRGSPGSNINFLHVGTTR